MQCPTGLNRLFPKWDSALSMIPKMGLNENVTESIDSRAALRGRTQSAALARSLHMPPGSRKAPLASW